MGMHHVHQATAAIDDVMAPLGFPHPLTGGREGRTQILRIQFTAKAPVLEAAEDGIRHGGATAAQ